MNDKLFSHFIKGCMLTACSVLLMSCIANNESTKLLPNTSYYPYLAEDQYQYFHRQNQISIMPATLAIPSHEIGTLEYELNAESWWGTWPTEGIFFNHFIAQHAKDVLGCGPLPEGTTFVLEPGIYTFKKQKLSISVPMTWQLFTNLDSICRTKIALPGEYYEEDSIYWKLPYSKNRVFPS